MPVIVREMDDDEAVIIMVDTNLEQRGSLLPSERHGPPHEAGGVKARGIVVEESTSGHYPNGRLQAGGESKSQNYGLFRLWSLCPA
jgi:ParB family chromosome partitioning protein